ncbi:phosphomannomutase [Desulfovibrio intestinalis]|uniref:Phosphomannomutase/phosphomannomutase/phosphoglu comutase n=1 Tax=Desulfovibrio intestinalis TaxID=58621 RepID=A0A7W8C3S7_9BACT|nr:phosphomannomutase [Desulfovibrio intestinalis]MBB5143175.1 phosphomannomutase/phosphomannomutase/phosphoglucomutase [Desulfovibrio intestinalis]
MLSCFKAYDIRGRVPDTLNAPLAHALGRSVVEVFGARRVVVGRDARLSGPILRDALAKGLNAAGAEVTDIGLCGTEEIYYAAANQPFDAGIMITGSHNPADENGFKLVRGGAIPVSGDSGLFALRDHVQGLLAQSGAPAADEGSSAIYEASFRADYVRWLLEYSGATQLEPGSGRKPLKIVADAGNGCAGLVLQDLKASLPFDFVCLHMEPDGTFPNGVPNPLLPERRAATAAAVREAAADMGVAWDGDFDRCFFYDGEGNFIEGYYCIGLLAQELLRRVPGGKIVYDTRVYWNTREVVLAAGGQPIMGKTGHAFMKERMRAEDAVYGGEMSAHHYFRDFAYCDSGMLPWLLVAGLLHRTGRSLADLVAERMAAYPCSGEINRRVQDAPSLMKLVRDRYAGGAVYEDSIDGVNLEFEDWRFNLRMSNTEPLLRLNVETRGNRALLEDRTEEILQLLKEKGGAVPA